MTIDRILLNKFLVEKFKELGISKLLLNEKQFIYQDSRMVSLELTEISNGDFHDEYISATMYGYGHFHTSNLKNLHNGRLTELNLMMENKTFSLDKFVGYVDKDEKIFINGRKIEGKLRQYIEIDGVIHINTSDTNWVKCYNCGKLIFESDKLHTLEENFYICDNCYHDEDVVTKCPICGEKVLRQNERRLWLSGRYKNLIDDIKTKLKVDINEGDDYLYMCHKCYNKHFLVCNYCDKVKLKDKEEEFCECRNRRVYDYSYKPTKPNFLTTHKPKKNTLFLGFEDECEIEPDDMGDKCDHCEYNPEDCGGCDSDRYDIDYTEFVKSLTRVLGPIVYCKTDGSLDTGFEIISEPMTYDFIVKNKENFREAFKRIIRLGAYSYEASSTGFHVHLSKSAFIGKEHMKNFAYLIHKDKDLSEAIAKRSNNSYGYINTYDTDKELREYIDRCVENPEDRYKAVNFCNKNTVEIRIYKGNLSIDSIIIYLQHVVSVFNYTAFVTKKHTDVSIDEYIKYVYNRGSKFKELKKEIKRIKGDK